MMHTDTSSTQAMEECKLERSDSLVKRLSARFNSAPESSKPQNEPVRSK